MHKIKIPFSFSILFLIVLNGAFSVFLYGNVIEKALLIDFPWLNSISTTEFPKKVLAKEENKILSNDYKDMTGIYGTPTTLRIPKLDLNMDLSHPLMYNNSWKISNTKVYLLPYSKSKSGLLGNSLIFANPDYKILDLLTMINEGDRMIIKTEKEWDYTYKVTKKYITAKNFEPHFLHTSPSKIIIIKEIQEKGLSQKNLIIEADYNSIEEEI